VARPDGAVLASLGRLREARRGEAMHMHMIHNEQTKLRATYLNNLGVGLAIGGGALPFIPRFLMMNISLAATVLVIWLIGIGLHLIRDS
jgi:hypothetical protein